MMGYCGAHLKLNIGKALFDHKTLQPCITHSSYLIMLDMSQRNKFLLAWGHLDELSFLTLTCCINQTGGLFYYKNKKIRGEGFPLDF